MNKSHLTITKCLALAFFSFSFQATQADSMKKTDVSKKSLQGQIHSLESRCAKRSERNPYATYRADLKTMRCVISATSKKPVCSAGYIPFKKKCIKGIKPKKSSNMQHSSKRQVVINRVPAKFNKAIFAKLLTKNGISKQEFKKIGGMKQVVNSLRQQNGKWTVSMSRAQVSQLVRYSGGKIKSIVGFGSFSFADVVLTGTKV